VYIAVLLKEIINYCSAFQNVVDGGVRARGDAAEEEVAATDSPATDSPGTSWLFKAQCQLHEPLGS
jgi:hypothetical protein